MAGWLAGCWSCYWQEMPSHWDSKQWEWETGEKARRKGPSEGCVQKADAGHEAGTGVGMKNLEVHLLCLHFLPAILSTQTPGCWVLPLPSPTFFSQRSPRAPLVTTYDDLPSIFILLNLDQCLALPTTTALSFMNLLLSLALVTMCSFSSETFLTALALIFILTPSSSSHWMVGVAYNSVLFLLLFSLHCLFLGQWILVHGFNDDLWERRSNIIDIGR